MTYFTTQLKPHSGFVKCFYFIILFAENWMRSVIGLISSSTSEVFARFERIIWLFQFCLELLTCLKLFCDHYRYQINLMQSLQSFSKWERMAAIFFAWTNPIPLFVKSNQNSFLVFEKFASSHSFPTSFWCFYYGS